MAVEIPYKREMEFEYGRIEQVAPGVRRVIANNPSAFTFHGTGTYILGEGEVAVIDPGPHDPNHIEAIFNGIEGETVTHVLITHTHMDHSPGYQLMKSRCDAVSYGAVFSMLCLGTYSTSLKHASPCDVVSDGAVDMLCASYVAGPTL